MRSWPDCSRPQHLCAQSSAAGRKKLNGHARRQGQAFKFFQLGALQTDANCVETHTSPVVDAEISGNFVYATIEFRRYALIERQELGSEGARIGSAVGGYAGYFGAAAKATN
jgi:hypothetical protein